jgi:hypothetical protein
MWRKLPVVNHFNIYCTGHQHSRVLCEALAKGTGYPMVPPVPLQPGGVAAYGFLRGLLPTLRQAQEQGRSWVYVDRGYLRATQGDDYSGYFRVTRNAWQLHGWHTRRDAERFKRLMLPIAPWRRGRHVLVCPPGDTFTQAVGGFAAQDWLESTLRALLAHTDRPIQIRHKPDAKRAMRPLAHDLQDCHALVTYMSNTAVEAVLAGVPVFTTGRCAASAMGQHDLTRIELPVYPDNRLDWAAMLAANQWTVDEIKRGMANGVFA